MAARYVLAPEAISDLFEIWTYLRDLASVATADHVVTVVRDRISFLASNPGIGHTRKDLTSEDVKFWTVYSYVVVYRPKTEPLQVAAILHSRRDIQEVLKGRS